jgi:hypothetical protein
LFTHNADANADAPPSPQLLPERLSDFIVDDDATYVPRRNLKKSELLPDNVSDFIVDNDATYVNTIKNN